jgi:hypothetical protein
VTGLLHRGREDGGSPDDRLIRAVEWELRRIAVGYTKRQPPCSFVPIRRREIGAVNLAEASAWE